VIGKIRLPFLVLVRYLLKIEVWRDIIGSLRSNRKTVINSNLTSNTIKYDITIKIKEKMMHRWAR